MANVSAETLIARRDLDFLLYEWLNVESLTESARYGEHSRDVFDSVLDLYEQVAVERFAPLNRTCDENEPAFDGQTITLPAGVRDALTAFSDTGLLGASLDQEFGGGQLPFVISRAGFAYLQAASASLSAYPVLTAANAALICRYGTAAQVAKFASPMMEGRYFGTMCLSEPDVGSYLGDVTTRAEIQDDGTYRIFGNKMWISGGDHDLSENIVHLVLARAVGAPQGVKGLSLFIVPKHLVTDDGDLSERNDVVLAGLNHKMGFRGTTNALLNFGEGMYTPGGASGAIGYLVGEPNQGLTYMFHMMNEARLAVGAGAVALGYTGYLHAAAYARQRTQGRALPAKAAGDSAVAIVRHPDVRRMVLSSKAYVEGGLALVLYSAMVMDRASVTQDSAEATDLSALLDVLTPIVKAWPSSWCLKANDLAIQVHGGYGYSREYPVEQLYRDNRLNPIHEGTDGIQSLDLVMRKLRMDDGAGLSLLESAISSTVAELEPIDPVHANAIKAALEDLVTVTRSLWASDGTDVSLSNSYTHAAAFGHLVVAWMWAEQLLACAGKKGDFYEGKRLAARYFLEHELPVIYPCIDQLRRRDLLFLELDDTLI